MRNTIDGATREENWSECQSLQVVFAGVTAQSSHLRGFIYCY